MPDAISADASCDEDPCEYRFTVRFRIDASTSMSYAPEGFPPHYVLFPEDFKQDLRSIALSDSSVCEESMLPDCKSTILY